MARVQPTERSLWADIARTLTRRDFVKWHPGYFLAATEADIDFGIFWISHTGGMGDPDWTSVGRDRVCDIRLMHRSVSKVHAHFQRRGDSLVVVDARSKNGTSVNDQPLEPGRPRKLAGRDRIHFGFVATLVLPSAEAFDLLNRPR